MNDDELMDRLLKDAMATEAPPQLSPAFEARLSRQLRASRLTGSGRVVLLGYAGLATATSVWFMRDVPVASIVAALVVTVSVAAAVSAYARRLVIDQ